MKVTINEHTCLSEIQYPCLMQGKSTKVIVLFSSYKMGTILHSGSHNDVIGHRRTNWNMDTFTTFNNSITMGN